MEFAVSSTAESAQKTLVTAAADTTGKFPTNPRLGSLGHRTKLTGESTTKTVRSTPGVAARTTSRSAKGGVADLDAFMQA